MHRRMHILVVISSVSRSPKCTKSLVAGASPQTPLRELTALPKTLTGFTSKGRGGEEREGEGDKMIYQYASGARILRVATSDNLSLYQTTSQL